MMMEIILVMMTKMTLLGHDSSSTSDKVLPCMGHHTPRLKGRPGFHLIFRLSFKVTKGWHGLDNANYFDLDFYRVSGKS